MQKILEFLGYNIEIHLHGDSSVSRSICHRSGVGRIRHLAVRTLWLQGLIRGDGLGNKVHINKVKGQHNCADIGTKNLTSDRLQYLMGLLRMSKLGDEDIPCEEDVTEIA